jgi:hypothetical protein
MATLALAAAGAAIGGSIGGGILGVSMVQIGMMVGSMAGNYIDNAVLTPDTVTKTEGSRLTGIQYVSASEGTPIPVLVGKSRVGGTLIWATPLIEQTVIDTEITPGKFSDTISEATIYVYRSSFAIGLCEGNEGMSLGRVWIDGSLVNKAGITWRFYDGTQTTADTLIESTEGVGSTPAFKGTAYVVFEDLNLSPYGNRIPQVTVEVINPIASQSTRLETVIEGANVIPGAGEFVYATSNVTTEDDAGNTDASTVNTEQSISDFSVSIDDLQAQAPNIGSASVVVGWFGSSTSAATCDIEPKVETSDKSTVPYEWNVGPTDRSTASVVTQVDGVAAYGGTPSDQSVREAFTDVKSRGLRAMFYPFVFMDMTGYPWRGRITGTASNLLGTADPSDFALTEEDRTDSEGNVIGTNYIVTYSGPAEWKYRRMILHYATLLSDILESGDVFLVGSEMVGMTQSDDGWGAGLATLIADVQSVLPAGVKISYASDWSEYNDPDLSATWTAADFIGIDYYLPLTDWRTDDDRDYSHDTFVAGVTSGEYWDYYYADEAARNAGTQTAITSDAFRQKHIDYWRDTEHPGKAIYLTELGCPAVDKGANQPNMFVDAKSDESGLPWFSNGKRDDVVQRRYIEGVIDGLTGVVDPANIFVWSWDARPYPTFPGLESVWADAVNYNRGHWLNGRLGKSSVADMVTFMMNRAGVADFDVSALDQINVLFEGMVFSEITSTRNILADVMMAYNFDASEESGSIVFRPRNDYGETVIDIDDFVTGDNAETFERMRTKDTDMPSKVVLDFIDPLRDYQSGSVSSFSVVGQSNRAVSMTTRVTLDEDYAFSLANVKLHESWNARDTMTFAIPFGSEMSGADYFTDVQLGQWFDLGAYRLRVMRVTYGDRMEIEVAGFDPGIYDMWVTSDRLPYVIPTVTFGTSRVVFAELPLASESQSNHWSPRVFGWQTPWPGGVSVYEDDGSGNLTLNTSVTSRAVTGRLESSLTPADPWKWDDAGEIVLSLDYDRDSLSTASDLAVLNGANGLAIYNASAGEWEVLQFANADLNVDGTYTLTRLLRGQLGTETVAENTHPVGSQVIAYSPNRDATLSGTIASLGVAKSLRYGPSTVDPSDGRYTDVTVTPQGVAYRPYSPVHLLQVKEGSGDITLTWVRRARLGGDSWEVAEVPLNEDSESYEVVITGGRTVTVSGATTYAYTVAQQATDFGSAQDSVTWKVAQIGTVFGKGPYGYE